MKPPLTIKAEEITVRELPLSEWGICPTEATLSLVRQRHLTKDSVFRLRAGAQQYALKGYSPHRVKQDILYEHRVIVSQPSVINAVAPIITANGSSVLEDQRHRRWALFPWIDGVVPDSTNRMVLCNAARLLARIHDQKEITPCRRTFPLNVSDELRFACPAKGMRHALGIIEGLISADQHTVVKNELASQIEVPGPRCQIHGDFSPDNTLLWGSILTVFDWERTRPGEAYYDLAWAAYRWGQSAWFRGYFIYTYGTIRNSDLTILPSITRTAVKFRFLRSLLHNADHFACDPADAIAANSIRTYASRIQEVVKKKDGWIPKFDSEFQRKISLDLAGALAFGNSCDNRG